MRLLTVIPARGGSKGLPGKNVMTVGGVSLVGRAVLAAKEALRTFATEGSLAVTRILVDTDEETIAAEARRWGAEVPFLRPAELAGDVVPMIDNVLFAVARMAALPEPLDADTVLLLQPTSPLRSPDDILRCLRRFTKISQGHGHGGGEGELASVVAVTPCDHVPEQSLHLTRCAGDGADDVISWAFPSAEPTRRRQDFVPAYRPAGSVYVSSVASLRSARSFFVPGQTRGVIVPRERAIDIDDRTDLLVARELHRLQTRSDRAGGRHSNYVRAYDFDDLARWRERPDGNVLVLDAGASLPDVSTDLLERPRELLVAPNWADFRRIHEAATIPTALASDDLTEHTLALAAGAVAFVAPSALHPEILRIAALVGHPAI
jgi:CMP-N-acetylneuraminic acid synthetase